MTIPSDHELAWSARRGDADAFGELVRRYQNSVFNVCYRLLGERREAEDLTQEAFLRAYQRLESYDLERPFGPWIRRIAANLCINRLEISECVAFSLNDERDEPASNKSAEIASEQSERQLALHQAIRTLPSHFRAVVELRHFQDMSYIEIADFLAIPLSDVKSHLFRARKILAEKLRAYE